MSPEFRVRSKSLRSAVTSLSVKDRPTRDIGGLTVPSGDYTLFVDLSDPNQRQLIVNKQTGQ